jgi:hypothetical protein
MIFFFFRWLMPRGWRRNQKYQGKIARQQFRDGQQYRRQTRKNQVNAQLAGRTDHSMPWWREPTVASMIGRRHRS